MADDAAQDAAAPSSGQSSKDRDSTGLVLPLARVKRIMREEADVKWISTEANYVLGRAAELFLQELAARAHSVMQEDERQKGQLLDYKDVAAVVHSWDALDFLQEVVPQKISAATLLAQVEQQKQQ